MTTTNYALREKKCRVFVAIELSYQFTVDYYSYKVFYVIPKVTKK